MSECFCKYGMAADALWVMYFCVNCRNLLMNTSGERDLWKFYEDGDEHPR